MCLNLSCSFESFARLALKSILGSSPEVGPACGDLCGAGSFPSAQLCPKLQKSQECLSLKHPSAAPKAAWDAADILCLFYHHHHESRSFQEFSLQPKTCLCFDSYLEAKGQLSNHNTQSRFCKLI